MISGPWASTACLVPSACFNNVWFSWKPYICYCRIRKVPLGSGRHLFFCFHLVLICVRSGYIMSFNCRLSLCWNPFLPQTSRLVDFLVKFQFCLTPLWNYLMIYAILMLLINMGKMFVTLSASLRALGLFGV